MCLMLEDAASIRKVVLACGYVDLCKGIDGLSRIIGDKYQWNPFEKGTLFLLCSRRTDRIKDLLWMGNFYFFNCLLDGKRFKLFICFCWQLYLISFVCILLFCLLYSFFRLFHHIYFGTTRKNFFRLLPDVFLYCITNCFCLSVTP